MFTKALKMLWDSESLKTIAEEHFVNTLFNWREECPKETVGICDDEFNSKGLALCSINITEANRAGCTYRIEAEYKKSFSNGRKVICILKFYDNFDIFDDVFYTENKGE